MTTLLVAPRHPQRPRLRLLRQEHGLSGAELARRVGVARTTLSKVEHGHERAWPRLRSDLARELDVEEGRLFGLDGDLL